MQLLVIPLSNFTISFFRKKPIQDVKKDFSRSCLPNLGSFHNQLWTERMLQKGGMQGEFPGDTKPAWIFKKVLIHITKLIKI